MNCKCGKPANNHVTDVTGLVKTENHYCGDCWLDVTRGTRLEQMAAQSVADGRRFNEWWDGRGEAERRMGPQCSAYAAYCLGLQRGREEAVALIEKISEAAARVQAGVVAEMDRTTRMIQKLTARCRQCGGSPAYLGARFCGSGCTARHEGGERPTWAAARGVDVGDVVVPAGQLKGRTLAQVRGGGGFAKTVESIREDGRVVCVWHTADAELERADYGPEELEVVPT